MLTVSKIFTVTQAVFSNLQRKCV